MKRSFILSFLKSPLVIVKIEKFNFSRARLEKFRLDQIESWSIKVYDLATPIVPY